MRVCPYGVDIRFTRVLWVLLLVLHGLMVFDICLAYATSRGPMPNAHLHVFRLFKVLASALCASKGAWGDGVGWGFADTYC